MTLRPCPVCGAARSAWTRTLRDYTDRRVSFSLTRCEECGVVYVDPPPSESELRARSGKYQAVMRQMLNDLHGSAVGRLGLKMIRNARTPPGPERGRVLDIGCSYGDYLARLRSLGWEGSGIEFDEEAARHARDALGLDVRTGRAEERLPEYPDEGFDLVTMWHVLEHVRDPAAVLTHAKRVLRPGGRLIVEVPNYQSFWSRLLHDYWFPLEYPFHLYHFTPSSLRTILVRTGFPHPSIVCRPAPAPTMWSFHMLWHAMIRRAWNGHLVWTPAGAVALYPIEMLLAPLGASNHMRAIVTRP